ncbi:MAG: hypothetical protein A3J51_00285 [Omnitrophica WOR_2 bacterium RIFCSPHIGHO2_02_FULL_45_21]|nr:MAG: hypothetical protein A3J51_00285 [Omnitrophica WOR_2 bacterium RIFCSPHIGHO2_02_FULL_45_21]
MKRIFGRTKSLRPLDTHYCSGCGHGVVHRLLAEAIDELNIRGITIGVTPVGCAVVAYDYWDFDCVESAHGRGLAVATAIKRLQPEKVVFTYQGDGDLAAIGTAETIHAANRGENLTVVFINNAVYGMTGGQMAPTTLIGQKSATSPLGRNEKTEGYPLRISELLAQLQGVYSVERTAVDSVYGILKTKNAIKTAFQNQMENKGFSLVEVLSACPTYWDMSAFESLDWIKNKMSKVFPLGRIK